ncbi:MAG: polyprenol monophosphomannose synthase [Flavobacteriales bacterium]|nr:MAG: polyprenol monophosphomannose synthase [Flavobacteriales bacterium TMED96]RZP12222.1 MAG: polyprenol monophosphomannose synthase [Flavobacteriales bacterium]|tara:strand:- start:1452 stop:2171 length:720 start_codon:yes stop_codon:yes gene_type:complete
MSGNLILIPTFNERENINPLLKSIFSQKIAVDVLILDDNSPDGTKKVVLENKKKYKDRLHLINREKKQGLGKAYIEGFKWALKKKYKKIIQMDADLSHPPEKLIDIFNELELYDYVIGSRYINGIRVLNWPLNRIILSIGASWYVNLITRLPVKDPTAGFVGYNRTSLLSLNLDKIMFVGYAFQIEMKFKLWKLGYNFKEIPITFKNRTQGESKMNSSIISEAIFGVIIIKFKSLFKKW